MFVPFVVFWALISGGNCARILGIIAFPSYSHQIVFQPLWRELSLRGHQVTTLTTDPINDAKLTNLTEIDLRFSYEVWRSALAEVIDGSQIHFVKVLRTATLAMQEISRRQLAHPSVQGLIHGDVSFDLLVVEYFQPSMFAFAERFRCPHIGVLSLDAPSNILKLIGQPIHPVAYPDYMLSFTDHSTFFKRMKSIAYSLYAEYVFNYYFYSLQQELVETAFGSNYSSLAEVAKNASLFFTNSDPILYKPKPFLPNVIPIGGGSDRFPSAPLPNKLVGVLDAASSGVIYFSLGTNVNTENLPNETRKAILEAFAEFPYTVLWKCDFDHVPDKPKNVHVSKWFPQKNVLGHPNVKLFITQGGLQSVTEAILAHVPMIIIPFFADQFGNAQRMLERGVGLSLDYTNLQKEEFKSAIREVITNPRYKQKATELAELAKDQPMTALERAIWWTEYVLRHKGAKHLRSPFLEIPTYQYFLLDVICVLLLILTVLSCVAYVLFKLALRLAIRTCALGRKKQKDQ
ncbi:UDP-glucuronosyltransferase 2B20-like [Photinus pyralis]|uniref:UDP-glucuronosyltransferase 2B20-like n=1 Tax=Photinus pyralis TaxID=7054 RepID=UPI0012676AE4|nr:UDP-glucuronosyltransferase 2B20-like [Photinus pyralis]